MVIKKIIADKKPKTCLPCPLAKSRLCGKTETVRGSSGAVSKITVPDKQCKIREG